MATQDESALLREVTTSYRADRKWTWIKRAGIAGAFGITLLSGLFSFAEKYGRWPVFGDYIAVVSIKGEIGAGNVASADNVIPVLRRAFADEHAKMVVLNIDSGGGSPIESERIYTEMASLKKSHPKPVVAVISTLGASAAYMIAMHCDRVVAGEYSTVGSIGVKTERYDFSRLADRLQVSQVTYASGDMKDMFDPFTPPSPAEKAKAADLVGSFGQVFFDDVKAQRGKKLAGQNLFTGEAWTGAQGLKLGLVDEIGTLETVANAAKLDMSYMGPGVKPSIFASFGQTVTAGVAQGVKGFLEEQTQIR